MKPLSQDFEIFTMMFNSDEVEPFLSSDTDDTDSDSELQEVVKLYKWRLKSGTWLGEALACRMFPNLLNNQIRTPGAANDTVN